MSFEPKKFNDVFEEMRRRTSVVTDFEVGSVTRTMYESFAYEIALLYEKMHLVYLSAYVDTAEGQQLDMVVSVLGIQRGLPDFAEGAATFERDVGNETIDIPIGMLIATEDTPEQPKKVYQTIETKVLSQDQTVVDVKIQAVNRGEDEETPAETIVIMPRPIPGIKSVVNNDEIRLLGKRRETDAELRERAKNALISSGKATIVSIENTLLSLPGVRDVRVKENFHFARGDITIAGPSGTSIPKGIRVVATIGEEGAEKPFETLEAVELDTNPATVGIQALLEGKSGELVDVGAATWSAPAQPALTITASNPIRLEGFGIIEVFVDVPNFDDPAEVKRIQEAIDGVRAAGIFVLLNSAIQVDVDAIFKIDINPNLSLSAEERAEFEGTVQTAIVDFLTELKLGQSFSFAKLIQALLSLDGIENLDDFQITTIQSENGTVQEQTFDFSDRQIDAEEFERFNPRYICVAAEAKLLSVNIHFQASGLDSTTFGAIRDALGQYFSDDLEMGEAVKRSEIATQISDVPGIVLIPETLQLTPEAWCPRPLLKEQNDDLMVDVSFVEQAVLGDVFAYHSFLEITGALKLSLPTTLTNEEKQHIRTEIRSAIDTYLDHLKSEEDVVFANLVSIASEVEGVLVVELDEQDFRVQLNDTTDTTEAPGRVTEEKITVAEFEKAQLKDFCITGDVETVEISVTAVGLDLLAPPVGVANRAAVEAALQLAVKNAINNFLVDTAPGDDVIYDDLKSAIENLISDAAYNVVELTLQAEASCDNRTQTTTIAIARNIHVRSVELPVMRQILDEADVVIVDNAQGEQ